MRLEVKVEEEDVVRRPRVALALLEYWREEAGKQKVELAEKDVKLRNREEVLWALQGYHYDSDDHHDYHNDESDDSDLELCTACDKECGYYSGHCPN